MREMTDRDRVERFMAFLGRESRGAGRVYLTGGASAVLVGWRAMTIDVDLCFDPEPPGAFEAIRHAKEALSVNIELAASHDFIPALPGWKDRSVFIARHGSIDFFHYDFYSQALSKLERDHAKDRSDVQQMLERELIEPAQLWTLFRTIVPSLIRYPAIDEASFRSRVERFLESAGGQRPPC